MICRRTRWAPSPHPKSGLPEFGTLKLAEVGYIRLRLGWGEGARNLSRDHNPSPHPSPVMTMTFPSTFMLFSLGRARQDHVGRGCSSARKPLPCAGPSLTRLDTCARFRRPPETPPWRPGGG